MANVDVQRILEHYDLVEEANEIVGVWEFHIQDCPVKLKIKVVKHAHNSEYPYMGIANYSVKTPSQFGPYRSLHLQKTAQQALEDALSGFFAYFKPELVDQTEFVLDENWND